MKPEYDFSKGAELRLPICLSADVQAYLAERAAQKGIPLGEMGQRAPKQEIQTIESVKALPHVDPAPPVGSMF